MEPKLIIDTREKKWKELMIPTLEQLGVPYTREALDAGDFSIDGVVVERKTISDLFMSIAHDGRFYSQPPMITRLAKRPVYAVIGDTSYKCPKCGYETIDELKKIGIEYNANVFYGALASLFVGYGIEIMWLKDDIQLMNILGRIFKKIQEGKSGVPYRGVKTNYYRSSEGMKIHFLSGVSGISPKIASRMIDHFKTVRSVILATKEQLTQVEGIGFDKADRMWRLINE